MSKSEIEFAEEQREKLIDIVEDYADFLDWDTKEEMVDSIMEFLAKDNNVPSKWIPVTESLPEYGERVIACGANGGVFMAKATTTHGFGKVDGASKYRTFNYWMPLPEPPKGE